MTVELNQIGIRMAMSFVVVSVAALVVRSRLLVLASLTRATGYADQRSDCHLAKREFRRCRNLRRSVGRRGSSVDVCREAHIGQEGWLAVGVILLVFSR